MPFSPVLWQEYVLDPPIGCSTEGVIFSKVALSILEAIRHKVLETSLAIIRAAFPSRFSLAHLQQ